MANLCVCVCVFLVETGFYHVGQASLKLLTSGDPPTSASQSAGITDVSHCTQSDSFVFKKMLMMLTFFFEHSPVVLYNILGFGFV